MQRPAPYAEQTDTTRPRDASGLPDDGGLGDHGGDHVGVHVGRRAAVLEVALAVLLRLATHAHRRATVGDSLQRHKQQQLAGTRVSAILHGTAVAQLGTGEKRTQLKVLMSAVSCLPVSRRSLPSP